MSKKNEKVQDNGTKSKLLSMNKWFYAFLAAAVLFVGAIVAVLIIALGGEETPVDNNGPLTEGAETGVYYYDAEKGEYLLSLNSGNKFTIAGPDLNKSGEYTVTGSEITLDFVKDEDKTAKVTIANNVLTMLWNDTEMRFLKKVSFNVTFQTDGGSAVTALSVLNGKTAAKPADPTKDGYAFIGWYADAACTKAFDFVTTAIGADTAVYAKWVKLEAGVSDYTVSFNLGFEGTAPAEVQTVNGKLYTLPTPVREGYTFAGWWVSAYEDGEKLTYACTDETTLNADTTLYALWIDNASQKLPAPAVSVSANAIKWDAVNGASSYALTVINAAGETVLSKNVGSTSESFDFTALAGGDYTVSVVAVSSDVSKNSEPAVRYYRNKALDRVSGFTVLDGAILIWNPVANAQKYLVTVDCGDDNHAHTALDNGTQTFFNIAGCKMQKGGIKITVVAVANGYVDSVAGTYTYEKNLAAIGSIAYNEETASFEWARVENAHKYFVRVKCANHVHELVDNGNSTSYCVKYCTGAMTIEVYPATVGYNSPEATQIVYEKKSLPAPTNVALNGKQLTWDAVAGATGYQVKIGGQTFPASTNSYNLDDSGITFTAGNDYTISVMAVGTNSSVYSDTLNTKAFAMTALTYNDHVVSWAPVVGQNNYEVEVNGVAMDIVSNATSVAVTLTKPGVNVIRVRYVGAGEGWSVIEVYAYEVTYDSRSISGVAKEYLAIGDTMSMPQSFELAGYNFAGWYNAPGAANGNGAAYPYTTFSENGDLVLYAAWTPKDYKVIFFGCENVSNLANADSVTVTYSKSFKLPIPVSNSGDTFSGWYAADGTQITDAEGNSLVPYDVTRDMQVYPTFDTGLITYTLRTDGTYAAAAGPNVDSADSITIPATYKGIAVTAILENGFYDSDNLLYIKIPSTIQLIGTGALGSCNILQAIEIYDVKTEQAYKQVYFSDQGALLYYDEPSDATYLELFPRGKDGHYVMSEEVDIIRDMAFERTSITSIQISKSVSYIAKRAFYDCKLLQSIEFAAGASDVSLVIESGAFLNCTNVKSFVLPARLSQFALSELDRFPALESVAIEDGNKMYSTVSGMLCDASGQKVLYCPTSYAANNGVFTPAATIRTIGEGVFAKNTKITEIVIPAYIETIEANAFSGCASLTTVTIESGRTRELSVGASAFANCKNLATVNLGSGVVAATTEIDEGVITFANNVFAQCENLRTVNVQGGVNIATLGANAFNGAAKLSKFNTTADVVIGEIGANAFAGTALMSFQLHASTTVVGDGAFANCREMTTFAFGESAQSPKFGANAFSGCVQLQEIVISAALTDFDVSVFGAQVKTLTVAAGNTTFATDNGVLYNSDYTTVIAYLRGLDGDLTKLRWDTITKIGDNAFKGLTKIESIVIGANVTEIGAGAFNGCTALASVTFAGTSYNNLVIGADAFKGTAITEIALPAGVSSIGTGAFQNCAKLKSVTMEKGVNTIGANAFYGCKVLETITLSESITEIATSAFQNCTALAKIVLPDNVTTIGTSAFNGCSKLAEINLPAALTTIGNTALASTAIESIVMPKGVAVGTGVFQGCTKLTSVTLPDGLVTVGESWFQGCSALTQIELPTTVTKIGKNAFNGSGLTSITLHEGITTISAGAFQSAKFTTITIPASVTYIEGGAFQSAKIQSITFTPGTKTLALGGAADTAGVFQSSALAGTVTLPDRVSTLGARAFYGCSNLTGIDLANVKAINGYTFYGTKLAAIDLTGVTSIGTYAFYNAKLTTVTIPSTVASISSYAFASSSAANATLTGLTIQEGVKTIGTYAFNYSAKLKTVTIPTSVTKIDSYAFRYCSQLTNISFTAGGTQPLTIATNAFANTSFVTITFPARLSVLGTTASSYGYTYYNTEAVFANNKVLTDVDVAVDPAVTEPTFSSYEGIIYRNYDAVSEQYAQYATLLYCPRNKVGEAKVHSATTLVETKAFYTVNQLTKITFESRPETDDTWNVPSLVIGHDTSNTSQYSNTATITSSTITQIVFPAHLKRVTARALSLTKTAAVTLTFNENSLFEVGGYMMANSKGLKAVENLRLSAAERNIFQGCSNLQSVTFAPGSTIEKFPQQMFRSCSSLTAIEIPASVEEIEQVAFDGCSGLQSLTFEEGCRLETIRYAAFQSCRSLTSIVLPDSLRWIDNGAFQGCSGVVTFTMSPLLTDGLDMAGNSLFMSMTSLEKIIVPASNPYLKDINGILFDKNETILHAYPKACKSELVLPSTLLIIATSALSGYQGDELILPNNLEEIGNNAFTNMDNLKSITIPATVKKIGSSAFGSCDKLASVIFMPGSQLEEIGGSAFAGTAITEIILPDNVNVMGDSVLARCYSLTKVILPAALTEIPVSTFRDCGSLKEVVIQNRVTLIDKVAFANSGIEEITLPDSLLTIEANAFEECLKLTTVNVSENARLNEIKERAFYALPKLTTIGFGKKLTTIGNNVFEGCTALADVTLPNSVTTLGTKVFYNCSALTNLTLSASLTAIPANTFENCGKIESVTIGAAVTEIGEAAFKNCASLATVTFDPTCAITAIGTEVFYGTTALSAIALPTTVISIGESAFRNSGIATLSLPTGLTSLAANAFRGCVNLAEVSIPNGLAEIGAYAFAECTGMTTLNLYGGLEQIGDFAFSGCTALQSVVIPSTVERFGANPFMNCMALTGFTMDENPNFTMHEGVLYNKTMYTLLFYPAGLTAETFEFPEDTHEIAGGAFAASKLQSIVIPERITVIPDSAFENSALLQSVTMSNAVTSIGSSAFKGCASLNNVEIPTSVRKIGDYAFAGCAALTNDGFVMKNTGAELGSHLFEGCASLTDILPLGVFTDYMYAGTGIVNLTIPEGYSFIKDEKTLASFEGVFANCTKLQSVTFPEKVADRSGLGNAFFANCTALTEITLPAGMIGIGSIASQGQYSDAPGVFANCVNLVTVNLPDGFYGFGDGCFENCVKLTTLNGNFNPDATRVGARAFKNCVSFTDTAFVGVLSDMGDEAFMNCTGLSGEIVFTGTMVNRLGARVFAGCTGITALNFMNCRKGINANEFDPQAFVGMDVANVKVYVVDNEGRGYEGLNKTGLFDVLVRENVIIEGGKK